MIDQPDATGATSELSLTERLNGLAEFLPVFESADFSFGQWHGGDGQMPWFSQSADASRFVRAAYDFEWVSFDINWTSWKQTDDAQRLIDDPNAIESASIEDLERLMTTFIRQDRFVEGMLALAYESGQLTRIIRRADALRQETDA